MSDGLKSNFVEMSNGFYSSRNQTVNSYVLRSASKNNVSRKQGVYSKFLNRNNISKSINFAQSFIGSQDNLMRNNEDYQNAGFKHFDPSHSRNEHPSCRKSLLKGNESYNPRAENGESSLMIRSQNGYSKREERLSPPSRNNESRVQNGTLVRDRRLSPPRNNESRVQNGTLIRDRRLSPPRNNESRIRPDSPTNFRSPIRNGHADLSTRGPGLSSPSYNGRTPEKDGLNSTLRTDRVGPHLSPRVLLKRFEPEYDQFGRPVGLKRDDDGFLVPNAPNQKRRCEEEKRITKKLLSELTDTMLHAEAFYFLKRCEDVLDKFKKKMNPPPNGFVHMDERKAQVVQWLQSTNSEAAPLLPVPTSVINAIPREVLQDYAASIISSNAVRPQQPQSSQQWNKETKAVYSLCDWTIVKGKTPIDVMVSGDLMDISNQTLIEEGHISSRVLSADAVVVQTSCCIYHLNGDFIDNTNSIPVSVKKYFQCGKFPKEWRDVIRMWSILKDRENSNLCAPEQNNRTTYDDVPERDDNRRIRPNQDERIPNGNEGRIREDRILDRHQQRMSEVRDQRMSEVRDQRIQVREDSRMCNGETQMVQNREQMIRNRDDQTFRNRDDQTIRNRDDQTFRNRDDQTFRNRDDQTIRNRDDQTIRNRDDQTIRNRDDQTIRNRENVTIHNRGEREATRNREDQPVRIRDGQTIRNREDQTGRNRDNYREEQILYEREEMIRNREFNQQKMREMIRERQALRMRDLDDREQLRLQDEDESEPEEEENVDNDRIRFKGFSERDNINGRKGERYQDTKAKGDKAKQSSHLDRKRKPESQLEDVPLAERQGKRVRLEKTISKRLATPGPSRRPTAILTRSAKARRAEDSLFSTPKSSKRITLKSRRKTPMPLKKGRRINCDSMVSVSLDNSDLM